MVNKNTKKLCEICNCSVTYSGWSQHCKSKKHLKTFDGINARVIQHEYDHIEGVLFTERLKPVKKRLVQRKLDNIRKGHVTADYKLLFKANRR